MEIIDIEKLVRDLRTRINPNFLVPALNWALSRQGYKLNGEEVVEISEGSEFNVGDIIRHKDYEHWGPERIVEIKDGIIYTELGKITHPEQYELCEGVHDLGLSQKEYNEVVNECIFNDEFKPGDILATTLIDGSKSIFIFREEKDGLISAYSSCSSGFFYTDTEFPRKGKKLRKAKPEERDLLFRMIEEKNLKWIPEELRFERTVLEINTKPDIDSIVQEYRDSLPFTGDYESYGDALAEAFRQGLVNGLNLG